ncbi:MAG TPA: alpha/beta family hydrolase [Thermoanaerobaculia bacterium]
MNAVTELEQTELQIPAGTVLLSANVVVPANATGVVLFAHGSGSSRHSPRNQFVASALNSAGIATVLADLLTIEEEVIDERTAEFRFDIPWLTTRVVQMIDWVTGYEPLAKLPIGLFGASTGAAAALDAAAARSNAVRAVVSRGGRVDLASDIARIRAAALFIVGEHDTLVLELNEMALQKLAGVKRLEVVPGAAHLFEEKGALERVAALARNWFRDYLRPVTARESDSATVRSRGERETTR